MKKRFNILLSCGLIVLLIAAVALTQILLRLAIPEKSTPTSPGQEKQLTGQYTTIVSETYIEVNAPEKLPIKTKRKAGEETISVKNEVRQTADEKVIKMPGARPAEAAPPPQPVGVVVNARGYAFATGTGGQLRPLTVNSRVYLNEKINTGTAAHIRIRFDDGTMVFEGESSVFLIDQYLYEPNNKNESRFGMCFFSGVCHIITGMITKINPDRFKVRTRMATVGIRGCDLAFKSKPEQEDLYVLSLSGKEHVRIETTSTGAQMLNLHTNEELPVDAAEKKIIDVIDAGTVYSIVKGIGVQQREIGLNEMNGVISEAAGLSEASHNMKMSRDNAVFTIQPQKKTSTDNKSSDRTGDK